MIVIFLDIDGVLNSTISAALYSAQYGGSGYGGYFGEDAKPSHENVLFDPECVRWLDRILKETKAKVVISSTWANHHDLNTFYDMFALYGLVDIEIVGKTNNSTQANRGREIEEYRRKHNISNYVIIDDNDEILESQQSHFVQIDPDSGLTEADHYRANRILTRG